MSLAYRFGCAAIRTALNIRPLADRLSTFSRVWSRHSRIYRHLKVANYDGVIDGGANVGEFAGLVRSALPNADLVCVEPHPGCAAALRAAGYRVVEAALWHSAGKLTLAQATEATTSCSVMSVTSDPKGTWVVESICLDDVPICGSKLLLKLDLQGAEIEAFKGMNSLWNRIIAVISEVSLGNSGNYEQVRGELDSRGYHEASTLNELEANGRTIEADKLWIKTSA